MTFINSLFCGAGRNTTMDDKSVETLGSKIELLSRFGHIFSPSQRNNVDFSISSTTQITALTQHWAHPRC